MTTVGTIPVFLQGDGAPACTVHNAGSVPVWLGPSSVMSGNGRLLDAGAKLIWTTGILYAVADESTEVYVYDGDGAEYDPKSTADALLGSGLADDIAEGVALRGAPPIRRSEVPFPRTTLKPNAGTNDPSGFRLWALPWFDVRSADLVHVAVSAKVAGNDIQRDAWRVWVEFQQEGSGRSVRSNTHQFWSGEYEGAFRCRYETARIVVCFDPRSGKNPTDYTPVVAVECEMTLGGSQSEYYESYPMSKWWAN